jgi:hypothetical protein
VYMSIRQHITLDLVLCIAFDIVVNVMQLVFLISEMATFHGEFCMNLQYKIGKVCRVPGVFGGLVELEGSQVGGTGGEVLQDSDSTIGGLAIAFQISNMVGIV